ncbi:RhuM family protein [Gracilibacillus salinarum]|uniref:Virulence RhuM family protein n=1 Tax=Gracilibacillus salinarum TaxID=2932255 RepID=A0ABY4GHE1_9BACI|nr:RhuM family protein [Gracilibacillus salinarum]UOQ83756.1 virulence RhuM family protein [Gracilibacillus salinarum]
MELDENAVVKFYLTTAKDGKNYTTKHYNLQMIIAIGYRVRSHRGTQFRQCATARLNEYLNRIVTMYLDYAEDQAERQQPMHMKEWMDKLNAFLQFNDRDILENAGRISKYVADKLAMQEYEKFNQHRLNQDTKDDFEQFIENQNLKK